MRTAHHGYRIAIMSTPDITKTHNTLTDAVKLVISAVYKGETVETVLKDIGLHPQTLWKVLKQYPELSAEYADARRHKAEMLVQQIVSIADSDTDPQKARNQIQVRQWLASKVLPKEYGDRLDVNVTQTIDIGSALTEARARALRPVSDQHTIDDVEYSAVPSDQVNGAHDTQSGDQLPSAAAALPGQAKKPDGG